MKLRYLGFGVAAQVALLAFPPSLALAADVAPQQQLPAQPAPARLYDVVLEVGAGGATRPAYEGSNDYKFNPTGFFTLHYLWLPGFGNVKSDRPREGLSIGPSFRYVYKRDSSDYPELRGLSDIDAAFEVGGRVAYQWTMFRPWVAVRYGFGGHSGIVGETGIDLRFVPTSVTEFTVGPRASFATSEYMQTYFGVTPAEAAVSGISAYNAGSGFKGVGAEATGRYEFVPQWFLVGSVIYERLIGDAANSPVVALGSENQVTAKLGVSYKFGLKLFKD